MCRLESKTERERGINRAGRCIFQPVGLLSGHEWMDSIISNNINRLYGFTCGLSRDGGIAFALSEKAFFYIRGENIFDNKKEKNKEDVKSGANNLCPVKQKNVEKIYSMCRDI